MNLIKYISILFTFLVIVSCTKELPFPDIKEDRILVVNSLFHPGEQLRVHVSESCHIVETNCSDRFVENANVVLKDLQGNVLTTFQHKNAGIYSSESYRVDENTSYIIEVSAPGHASTLRATNKVPKMVDAEFMGVEIGQVQGNTGNVFDLKINDPADEENYYIIEGNFDILNGEHRDGYAEVNGYIEPHFRHFTDDPNADNEKISAGFDFVAVALAYVFLPDANFNGQSYTTRIGVIDDDIYDGDLDVKANIFVRSVSKEMYEYLKTIQEHQLTVHNIFSEPKIIFDNIENGVGIFAGYTENKFTVDVPESTFRYPSKIDIENEGCTTPCIVGFSTDGGPDLSYFWEFGDGETSSDPNPQHSYASQGVYNVILEVTNSKSGSNDSSGFNFQVTVN